MWPLEPPAETARESYDACVSSTRDASRQERLTAAAEAVEAAGERFRAAAHTQALHALEAAEFKVPGIDDKAAVTWAYENGMRGTKKGRLIYDKLMGAPLDERCPLCGHGTVRQLDHVLPKASFPALCVAPLNLVPACSDCNHSKGDQKPTAVETTPLHPYLDRIDDVTWLQARVIHDVPVRLEFFVAPPPTWGQVLIARAAHHFTMFGLAKTYAVQANRTLRNIQHTLIGQFKAGGKELVHEYLAAEAATRLAVQPNGWEGVTYRTLAADGAFCNGGFLE